jgi:serine/threonine protein kinase
MDIWSLGCVFSLALVWSVLGPDELKNYQDSLKITTAQIPEMRDSAYVGCFHDGEKLLEEVHSIHNQVIGACGRSDYIIYELVPIIVDMLEVDPRDRPSAMKTQKKCHQALDRATRMSATEENSFPPAFRNMDAKLQTPQEVYHPSFEHGLGIDGATKAPATEGRHDPNIDSSYAESSVSRVAELQKISQKDSGAKHVVEWREVETWLNRVSDNDRTQFAELGRTVRTIPVGLIYTSNQIPSLELTICRQSVTLNLRKLIKCPTL